MSNINLEPDDDEDLDVAPEATDLDDSFDEYSRPTAQQNPRFDPRFDPRYAAVAAKVQSALAANRAPQPKPYMTLDDIRARVSAAKAAGYGDNDIADYIKTNIPDVSKSLEAGKKNGWDEDQIFKHMGLTDYSSQGRLGADINKFGQAVVDVPASLAQGVGRAIQGVGTYVAHGANAAAEHNLNFINQVDAGMPVSPEEDSTGYTVMNDAEKADYRKRIEDQVAKVRATPHTGSEMPGYDFGEGLAKWGEGTEEWAKKAMPVAAKNEQNLDTQVVGMVPGLAKYMAAGLLGPAALPAILSMGGADAYASTFKDAKTKGANDETAHEAAAANALISAPMMIAPLHYINESVPPMFKSAVINKVTDYLAAGGVFTGFNKIQEFVNNAVAQQTYDPKRDLTQGLAPNQGDVAAMIVGAGAHGISQAMKPEPTETPTNKPEPPADPNAEFKLALKKELGLNDDEPEDGSPPPNDGGAPPSNNDGSTEGEPPSAPHPDLLPKSKKKIKAEVNSILDPDTDKDSMFVPADSVKNIPQNLDDGIIPITRPEGTLLTTNPNHAAMFYGADNPMSTLDTILKRVQPNDEAIDSEAPLVVQVKNADGEIVDTAIADIDHLMPTVDQLENHVPEGGTIEVLPPEESDAHIKALREHHEQFLEAERNRVPEPPVAPEVERNGPEGVGEPIGESEPTVPEPPERSPNTEATEEPVEPVSEPVEPLEKGAETAPIEPSENKIETPARRLVDAGEYMPGKRADMRKSLDDQASGDNLKDLQKIQDSVSKAALWPIEQPEGASTGVQVYLRKVRDMFPGFVEHAGRDFGGGRRSWQDSFSKKLTDAVMAGKIDRIRDKAADYGAFMETAREATKDATTVEEARRALEKLLLTPDANLGHYYIADEHLTDAGKIAASMLDSSREIKKIVSTDKYTGIAPYITDETPLKERNKPMVRPGLENIERSPNLKDHRNGKDVDQDDLIAHFGFKGVQFGDWVNNKERQANVNHAFDALHDLADTLGIPPRGISLGGKLGLSFGARGRGGKAAAHYEPDTNIINLTRTQGDGTVAHEWGHALDYALSKTPDGAKAMAQFKQFLQQTYDIERTTGLLQRMINGTSYIIGQKKGANAKTPLEQAKTAIYHLLNSPKWRGIKQTDFKTESDKIGKNYWGTPIEMFARAFESVVHDKQHGGSPYLVSDWVADGRVTKENGYKGTPYPVADERRAIFDAIDDLMDHINWDKNGEPSIKPGYESPLNQLRRHLKETLENMLVVNKVAEPEPVNPFNDMPASLKAPILGTPEDPNAIGLGVAIAKALKEGADLSDIVKARKFASGLLGGEIVEKRRKDLDEAIEIGVTLRAREIIQEAAGSNRPVVDIFNDLVELYKNQPRLMEKDPDSKERQAYSTPAPIAYLVSKLAGIDPHTTVYEPTAGNGMLLIGASHDKVTANELGAGSLKSRYDFLRTLFNRVTNFDAASWKPQEKVDVVVGNPPFGKLMGADNRLIDFNTGRYKTKEIDHAIALKALETMKDDGSAVLILGGKKGMGQDPNAQKRAAYNSESDRAFYKVLLGEYNVTDHFTIDGKLYERQGAGWPIDVLVIKGRGKSELPFPGVRLPEVYHSFDQLREVLNDHVGLGATEHEPVTDRRDGAAGDAEQNGVAGTPDREGPQNDVGTGTGRGAGRNKGTDTGGISGNGRGRDTSGKAEPVGAGGNEPRGTGRGASERGTGSGELAGNGDRETSGATGNRDNESGSVANAGGADRGSIDKAVDDAFANLFADETNARPGNKTIEATDPVDAAIKREAVDAINKGPAAHIDIEPTKPQVDLNPEGRSIDAIGKDLDDLFTFQHKERTDLAPEVDQDRYEKAAPLLKEGIEKLGGTAKDDVISLAHKLLTYLRDSLGMARDKIERMLPYVKQFIADVKSGLIRIGETISRRKENTEAETKFQVKYDPKSDAEAVGSVTPINMKTAIKRSLDRLEDQVGNVDDFVAKQLGMTREKIVGTEDKAGVLSGEQVDAVAMAIDNLHKGSGMIIGDQCVAGETLIYDPVLKKHTAIETLAKIGKPITVLSLTKFGFKQTKATAPFLKGVADLYQVTLSDGKSIKITKQHRFLTPLGWASLDNGLSESVFVSTHEVLDTKIPSIHDEDVPSCLQKPQDCLGDYYEDCHQGDEQPLCDQGIDQVFVPSQVDAHEHTLVSLRLDGQEFSQAHTPLSHDSAPRSKKSSFQVESRDLVESVNQADALSVSMSELTRQNVTQFVQSLTVSTQANAQVFGGQLDLLARDLCRNDCELIRRKTLIDEKLQAAARCNQRQLQLLSCQPNNEQQFDQNIDANSLNVTLEDHTGWRKIVKIEFIRRDKFYDMHVPGPENYVAQGFVNHNTGLGKGRIVASVIKWAKKNGKVPIFVTKSPGLYADMYRDLSAIGENNFNALVTNSGLRGDKALPIGGGRNLESPTPKEHQQAFADILRTGKLPKGYDAVFTTYSQMQFGGKGKRYDRHDVLERLAPNSIIIMDESHEAGGTETGYGKTDDQGNVIPTRADFARKLLSEAQGSIFSSATYAKNPHVMSLYFTTDMALAVDKIAQLPELIKEGGVPLQQIVANMLVDAGQYVRRERSFDGIGMDMKIVPVDMRTAEQSSQLLRGIFDLDKKLRSVREAFGEDLQSEGNDTGKDSAIDQEGATSVNFTSLIHNIIGQSLLALKTKPTIDEAIAAWKRGEKPIIAVSNTFGALLDRYVAEHLLKPGDDMHGLTFNRIFDNYLNRTREVSVKDPLDKDKKQRVYIDDQWMEQNGFGDLVEEFDELRELIGQTHLESMPGSPLDYIMDQLRAAGMHVGEITGRGLTIENNVLTKRSNSEAAKKQVMNDFNDGKLDALLINRSGSTGFSLHASPANGKDVKPRHMMLLQADPNIDTFMQMLGRIFRTGQVELPIYSMIVSDLPTEKRPAANILKKMSSLNANVSANKDSAMSLEHVVDFLNVYGDEVVARMLQDEPELADMIDVHPKEDNTGIAAKATGRIAIFPPKEQERIFAQIEQDYKDEIETADKMGRNKLVAKTLELDARTLTKNEVTPDKGVDSPFAFPSYLERIDAKKLGDPYTADQIKDRMASLNKIESGEVSYYRGSMIRQELMNEVRALETEQRTALQNALEQKRSDLKRIEDALADDIDPKEKEKRTAGVNDDIEKLQNRLNNLSSKVERIAQLSETAQPNSRMLISSGSGENLESIPAISFGIFREGKAKDPLAYSNFVLRAAIADAGKEVKIPLGQIVSGRYEISRGDYSLIDAAFTEGIKSSREQRHVITGNIPAGFAKFKGNGQIVLFKDNEGNIKNGILLPKKFDPQKFLSEQPVTMKPEHVVQFLDYHSSKDIPALVTSDDGGLTVQAVGRGYLFQTKTSGKMYYLNPQIKELMGRNGWTERKGSKKGWNMEVPNAEMAIKVMRIYESNLGTKYEAKAANDIARKIVNADQSQMMRSGEAAGPAPDMVSQKIPNATVYTDLATEAQRMEAQRILQRALNERVGLTKANVRVVDRIDTDDEGGAWGTFPRSGNTMYVTLRDLAGMADTANHEVIHFMREAGMFTGAEWAALTKNAAEWREQFGIDRNYAPDTSSLKRVAKERGWSDAEIEAKVKDRLDEEAVAFASTAAANGQFRPANFIARILDMVTGFRERLSNLFKGAGFKTAKDILNDVHAGRFADQRRVIGNGANHTFLDSSAFARKPKTETPKSDFESHLDRARDMVAARHTPEEMHRIADALQDQIAMDKSKAVDPSKGINSLPPQLRELAQLFHKAAGKSGLLDKVADKIRPASEAIRTAEALTKVGNKMKADPPNSPLKTPEQVATVAKKAFDVGLLGRMSEAFKNSSPIKTARKVFSPGDFDQFARHAAMTIRDAMGRQYFNTEQAKFALRKAIHDMADKDQDFKDKFAIAYETNKVEDIPEEWREAARQLFEETKKAQDRLERAGIELERRGELRDVADPYNDAMRLYLGKYWRKRGKSVGPENEREVLAGLDFDSPENRVRAGIQSKKSLKGYTTHMMRRSIDTYADARKMGFEPVFSDPITTQLHKIAEMNKHYAGLEIVKAAKESKTAKFFTNGQVLPNGYTRLEGREFERKPVLIKKEDGSTYVPEGHWYAPEGFATVYNNFVSRGMAATPFKDVFEGLRDINNMLNSAQLGLSAFHAFFTTNDVATSYVAIAMDQIVKGNWSGGFVNLAKGMTVIPGAIENYVKGDRLIKVALDPKIGTPEEQALVEAWANGGGRIWMDRDFMSTDGGGIAWQPMIKSMMQQFGHKVRESNNRYPDQRAKRWMNNVGIFFETASWPIMTALVPRQKAGVFARYAQEYIDTHPNASETERTLAFQDIQDTVDNRLGQMVYDNVFWNKMLKDVAIVGTRSVGWNMGTIREIGGGAVDMVNWLAQPITNNKMDWTRRQSYLFGLTAITMMEGALLCYAATGKGPQDLIDYFFPPNGLTKDVKMPGPNGKTVLVSRPDRWSTATYMKDVFAYANDPVQTVQNKASPLLSALSQIAHNRDYRGDIISGADTWHDIQYAQDVMGFAVKQFMPFSFQGLAEDVRNGKSPANQRFLNFVGITNAPGYIVAPDQGPAWEHLKRQQELKKAQKRALERAGQI